MMKRFLISLVLAAALFAACAGDDDSGNGDAEGGAPPLPEADEADGGDSGEEAEGEDDADDEDDSEDAAVELTFGGPVEPGVYTTDILGTTLDLGLAESWIAAAGGTAGAVFVDPETETETSELMLVARVNALPTDEQVTTEPEGISYDGDPNDIDAWIDAVGELIIGERSETTVGGRDAEVIDIRVDPDGVNSVPGGCGSTDDRCFFVASTGGDALFAFIVRTTEVYRMWLIEQGDEDPVMVLGIADENAPEWLDERADPFVDGLAFGEPAPHPVPPLDGPAWEAGFTATVPPGVQSFPVLDGIQLELPEEHFILQQDNCMLIQSSFETDSPFPPTAFITRTPSAGFNQVTIVESVDDFVGLYGDEPISATGETLNVLGVELERHRLDGAFVVEPPGDIVNFRCGDTPEENGNFGFTPGGFGDVYLGELDGGVLAVGFSGFAEDEEPAAQELFDFIQPTITAE